jgi:hypothetical protein
MIDCPLMLEVFESEPDRLHSTPPATRRATSKCLIIPLFLTFQFVFTQGEPRESVEVPIWIALVHEGVVGWTHDGRIERLIGMGSGIGERVTERVHVGYECVGEHQRACRNVVGAVRRQPLRSVSLL